VAVDSPAGGSNGRSVIAIGGVVGLVTAEVLVWIAAGSIWWSFQGLLRGGPGSEAAIEDARFALAMFVGAAANAAVLLLFLVRRRRRFSIALGALQAVDIVVAVALALLIDEWWFVIAALAAPALALIAVYEWTTMLSATSRSRS